MMLPPSFVIGVAGGTASGKTTACDRIVQRLNDRRVVLLAQDSFYRSLTEEELADVKNYNFDHPDALDRRELVDTVAALKAGRSVRVPEYDFATHRRREEQRQHPGGDSTATATFLEPADVIIVEGILVLALEELRPLLDMKVYIDTDDDVRLARRIQRDIGLRGRDVVSVIEQYTRFVKPAFDRYIGPSRRHADVIVPWQRGDGEDNRVAIDLIAEHIRIKLRQHPLLRAHPSLEIVPASAQMRGMLTIVRDRTTTRNDFVFYANRLCRLVVEAGLGHLPFAEKVVTTPGGHAYRGVEFARGLCGVSVIRGGEAMETALRECCQGVKIGKVLVGEDKEDNNDGCIHGRREPPINTSTLTTCVYAKLPVDIADRFVLLLDPVLGGGGARASRVIDVLLSRGVRQERILFLCLLAAPAAVRRVCGAYPGVRILTGEIEADGGSDEVDEVNDVVPGLGRFGDRYFCV